MDRRIKHTLKVVTWIVIVLLLFAVASRFPLFIERNYSNGLYPVIADVLQLIFNSVAISLGDIFYVILIALCSIQLIRILVFLFRKKYRRGMLSFLHGAATTGILLVTFYLFWGLNYFRLPAEERFSMTDSCCNTRDIRRIAILMADSVNFYREHLNYTDRHSVNTAIYRRAIFAVKALKKEEAGFRTFSPRVKSSLLTWGMNYIGTAGYYNPFTGESQVNYQMPLYTRPFTACHEMIHQMGYGSEDEANFGGFLAASASPYRLFRYSAYYSCLGEFMFELRLRDSTAFKEVRERVSPGVLADFKAERDYWRGFHGQAGVLSSLMYDNYLKLNNQPEGLRTYNRMVRLVIGWSRKKNMPQPVLSGSAF